MRIGHGYDVHAFGDEDVDAQIVLGGVPIPSPRPLMAHSDGDVVIHALCDALLGAIGEGDIGRHFPDTDPANAGISSRKLLRRTMNLVRARGYKLGNCDLTVIAQAPKMAPHVAAMCEILAEDTDSTIEQINVKATTTEKLGFAGRGEGIAVHAVVLLERL